MLRDSFREAPTRLYGVLSRSAILKNSNRGKKTSGSSGKGTPKRVNIDREPFTMTFLMDAIEEAVYRQTLALECLELERGKLMDKLGEVESNQQHHEMTSESKNMSEVNTDNNPGDDSGARRRNRDPRIALDRVDARSLELREKRIKLEELRCEMVLEGSPPSITTVDCRFRSIMGSTGKPCSILDRPKDTWKIVTERSRGEFGRPKGFQGLVFYSPLGVPILVGKLKAESDGILRRASQGSDLWFQVEDYDGSRVLLRSSLVRGTKDSKKCLQMAADLAAFYSVWGKHKDFDSVPVMYTDSKHVAKRGTKVGRMRKRKSLGRLMGRPSNVRAIARGMEL